MRRASTVIGVDETPRSTAYEVVRDLAVQTPDAPAFELIGLQRVSYLELVERVEACAAMLFDEGVRYGDRVAMVANNRAEILETWLACGRIGAVFVPFNPALRGHILKYMIELTEPAFCVCEPEWQDRIREVAPDLRIMPLCPLDNGLLTAWRTPDHNLDLPENPHPEDLSIIMFTSGTTGKSKGVMWSHMTINYMAASTAAAMQLRGSDSVHTALPMFHGNALILSVYTALLLGARTVVSRRFSATNFVQEIVQSGATATSLLGAMSHILLKQSRAELTEISLQKALVIPAPREVTDALQAWLGCKVTTGYGLADAGSLPLWSGYEFPSGTCGRVLSELWEARLVDESGKDVTTGTAGELVVHPRLPGAASLGYWRMPEETLKTYRDGWIHTGDLMKCDDEGWFYFVDRAKDAMRRRGENVSSAEVETAFHSHPAVLECTAYPVPSELSEDEIMLAVVFQPGQEVQPLELIKFVEPRLPYFAIPRFIRVMETLPRNSTQKILKAELRGEAVIEGTWDLNDSEYVISR